MVENADDDPVETKQIFVDNSGEVTPSKVEAKPNIDEASIHVEASLYVDSNVAPLDVNEVDTTQFFSSEVTWKDRDDLLNWVCRQANREGFIVVIHISNFNNPMLQLLFERSGDHKTSRKRMKYEATGSRKCGCMFMLRGYLIRKTNDWRLYILNGVHNHEMKLV
jgi:hypothetical protein